MEPPVPISEREVPDARALPPARTGALGAHEAMQGAPPSGPATEASLALVAAMPRATAPPPRRLCKARASVQEATVLYELFDCTCCSGVGYDEPVDLTGDGDGGLHCCFLEVARLHRSFRKSRFRRKHAFGAFVHW